MAAEKVKDYLGHPCQFTEAVARFAEHLDIAKKHEPQEIKRQIGTLLNELDERIGHSVDTLDAMKSIESECCEQLALLPMAIEYEVKTNNLFWTLAGAVLAALEMCDFASMEVAHG